MFSVFTSNSPDSPNTVHNGNTVTIMECSNKEDQVYMVMRYDETGTPISWYAHVSELSNFEGDS